MSYYMSGAHEAFRYIWEADEATLLEQLDALEGRDQLPASYTLEQLRDEAMRQTRLDWLDSSDPDYWRNKRRLEIGK